MHGEGGHGGHGGHGDHGHGGHGGHGDHGHGGHYDHGHGGHYDHGHYDLGSHHADEVGCSYCDNFPGTHHSDHVSGIVYYQDGLFHSGSLDFLDSYTFGGASYGGFHSIGNNAYLLGLMLSSDYSHSGLGLYPFGYILFPLAMQLYQNSQSAAKEQAASGQAPNSHAPDVFEVNNKREIAHERDYFGAHVAHGFIDVHDAFKSLALRSGLSRVRSNDNWVQIEPVISDKSISDWNRFVPPYTREVTPKGYYPGATGLTYFTQQCWTAAAPPDPSAWSRFLRALDSSRPLSQIRVRIVTWYFDRVDDYETRLDIKVTPGRDFVANQIAASKLCGNMLAILQKVKPTSFAEAKRCKIFAGNYLF